MKLRSTVMLHLEEHTTANGWNRKQAAWQLGAARYRIRRSREFAVLMASNGNRGDTPAMPLGLALAPVHLPTIL